MNEEKQDRASGDFVQSLARGLSVIRAFDEDHPRMTLIRIAERTGLTRATARRFAHTLVTLGYMSTDGKDYWLAPQTLTLGYSYLSGVGIAEIAAPHLNGLSNRNAESSSLAVLDGTDIVYIARTSVRRIMRAQIGIGTRFPAYCTSMGRMLMAGLSDEALDTLLAESELVQRTPVTVTDPNELRKSVARIREQGWSMIIDELEAGVGSVSAPVYDGTGAMIAALNVSRSTGVGSQEQLEAARPDVMATAKALTEDIIARDQLAGRG